MRLRACLFVAIIVALIALPVLAADPSRPYPTDAQSGRAIGAKQMAAQELKQKLDSGEPVLLIEVRDVSFYEKETIPGTIHIPFARLQEAMKDIPKDRTLVFICGTGRQSSHGQHSVFAHGTFAPGRPICGEGCAAHAALQRVRPDPGASAGGNCLARRPVGRAEDR